MAIPTGNSPTLTSGRRCDACTTRHPAILAAAFLLAVLAGLLLADVGIAFEPARRFPDTWDRIRVFVDQLPADLTSRQKRFAALYYVGTQKLTSRLIHDYRAINPDFIMLQYRLGVRESDPSLTNYIHNDRWVNDWATITQHEDWFYHTGDRPPRRVYQIVAGKHEYIMDISGRVNGNLNDGWKEYWARTVLRDARRSGADGVFADGCHIPYAVPPELANSPLGTAPYLGYLPHLEAFYGYAYRELDRAGVYFIPNIGNQVTGWDTTAAYFKDVHGAMVEGFGMRSNHADWQIQTNNTLKLIRNDKIYIAQSSCKGPEDIQGRLWFFCNFLLLKHGRSYINLMPRGHGIDGNLNWWPEYDLKIGAPVRRTAPEEIDRLRHSSGIYFRHFERGIVLLNPSQVTRKTSLAGDHAKYEVLTPWGGGLVDFQGRVPQGGLRGAPAQPSITLGPWSGAILMKRTTP
ncbi:MAG: hypothetical protein HQ581_19735 [Planctomycetes bacterium]|nr:hypothetical protein [Planctomycetota bacterium]